MDHIVWKMPIICLFIAYTNLCKGASLADALASAREMGAPFGDIQMAGVRARKS